MSPASCDILYACPVIVIHSSVSCVCQLFLLRMSECGLRSTATTEQWYSYGE